MPRFTPCRACRKRQKGCFWENDSTTCLRCKTLHLICIPSHQDSSSDDYDVLPREVGPKTLEYWNYEITLLENEIRRMEFELDDHREVQRHQQNLEWFMNVENGQLRLHTPITDINELILFGQASLRYLSPFQGVFNITTLRFDNTTTYTIVNTFCKLYSQAVNTCPNNRCILAPPPSLETEARSIIDDLIQAHFKHVNPKIPFLHEPSFLQHYHSLTDPLLCSLTLAVCIHCISTVYDRPGYSGKSHYISCNKRRQLAEFFYARCKELLVDMFDDPTQAIQTIFTITFLQYFVTFGLAQPSEARRLASISYLLCKDLESTINKGVGIIPKLLQRHFLFIQHWLGIYDVLIDQSNWRCFYSLSYLEPIPDESEISRQYLEMINYHIRLWKDPCVDKLVTLSGGQTSYISFEAVLKTVAVIREWWENLPSYLRLCDNVYQVDPSTIDQSTQPVATLNLGFVHSSLLRLHAPLIAPLSSSMNVDHGSEILEVVRKNATEMILRSCDILLSVIIHLINTPDHDIPPISLEFTTRVIHALINVSCQPNAKIPVHLQQKFYRCVDLIRATLPYDNRVPPGLSPLNTYWTTKQVGDLTVYRNQPMLGTALAEDLFSALYNQLHSYFVHHSQNNSSSPRPANLVDAILRSDSLYSSNSG